jgi:hypothetical protein
MGFDLGDVAPKRVSAAIAKLVGAGLLAVRRGSGPRGSAYLMALPVRAMVTQSAATPSASLASQQEASPCPAS